jgi:hypothetical protein
MIGPLPAPESQPQEVAGDQPTAVLKVQVSSVVGVTDGWWSHVQHFPADGQEKADLLIVASFRLVVGSEVDAVIAGRRLLSQIQENYTNADLETPWERLQAAVQSSAGDLEAPGGNEAVGVSDLGIIAGVLVSGALAVVGYGSGGEVYLTRGGETDLLFTGQSPLWGGSGYVNGGDILLLGTKRFFQVVSLGMIRAAMREATVDDIAAVFLPAVQGKKEGEGAAAAVVGFTQESLPAGLSESGEAAEAAAPELTVGTAVRPVLPKLAVGRLFSFLRPLTGRFHRGGQTFYVRSYHPPRIGRRATIAMGILLLLVLFASILLGVRFQNDRQLQVGPVGQARAKLTEAEGLLAVAPDRARTELLEAQTIAGTIPDKKQRESLLAEIAGQMDQASGIHRKDPETFLDYKLIRDDLLIAASTLDGDYWWGLDPAADRLVRVSVSSKQPAVVAGKDQLGGGKLVTALGEKAYVLGGKGVVEIDAGSQRSRVVIPPDPGLTTPVALVNFNNNLYLLDGKTIWKYPATDGGFGAKVKWTAAEADNALVNASTMAIDGSIWVGFPDGTLKEFTQGKPETITPSGLDQPLGKITSLWADTDHDLIYILDAAAGRIVIMKRTGEYAGQFISPALREAIGVAVSGTKLLITMSGKLGVLSLQ